MSLTGPFSTMPLAEVLGRIGTTNRLGILTVHGVRSETRLHLERGHIVECATSDPPALLGQFLLFHGVIDEHALHRAMRVHEEHGRRLGEVLLEMGAVSAEDLIEMLAVKAEESVLGVFDHPTGWFTFDPSVTSLDAPLEVDMSVGDVIAHGDKRVKNAEVAAATLKRSGSVLRKTAKPASAKLSSVWPLRNAYALVDGERSIDEIVLHMHGSEFHVLQRLHQLVAEGFIEVVKHSGSIASSVPEPEVTEASIQEHPNRVEPAPLLEGIFPVALPPEFVQESGHLSIIEKYLLTLCDGKRDLQWITAVAPVQSSVVVETIQSLQNRGWLQALPPPSDH